MNQAGARRLALLLVLVCGGRPALAHEGHAELYRTLGVVALEEGQYQPALRYLRLAVAETPDDAATVYALALAQVAAGYPKDGVVSLRRLLVLDPDHPSARLELAAVLTALGHYDEAGAALSRRTSVAAGEAEAAYLGGLLELYSGQLGPAATQLRVAADQAGADTPLGVASRFYLARVEALLGELDASAHHTQAVVDASPGSAFALALQRPPEPTAGVPVFVSAALSTAFDSNVALRADGGASGADDVRLAFALAAGGELSLADDVDALGRASLYKSFHLRDRDPGRQLDTWRAELDVSGRWFLRSGAAPVYLAGDYAGSIDLVRNGARAGGSGPYLYDHRHAVGPRLWYSLSHRSSVEAGYRLVRAKFDALTAGAFGPDRRDFLGHELSAGLRHRLDDFELSGALGVIAQDADGEHYDQWGPWLSAAAELPLLWDVRLTPAARVELASFPADRTSADGVVQRTDWRVQLGLGLAKPITNQLEVSLEYGAWRHRSTFEPYDFTRHIIALTLGGRFL